MKVDHTHHLFTWFEHELLIQLQEIETILRATSLNVDFAQKLTNDNDYLRQDLFVRIIVRRLFQHGF